VRAGIQRAAEAIDSGSAAKTLAAMVAASKRQVPAGKTS
jgi:anthranilate phosphoribosyltransferase